MTTDPDKLLRIAHAHVTMATDLAADTCMPGAHAYRQGIAPR